MFKRLTPRRGVPKNKSVNIRRMRFGVFISTNKSSEITQGVVVLVYNYANVLHILTVGINPEVCFMLSLGFRSDIEVYNRVNRLHFDVISRC